jgi:hypothetical protein
MAYSALINGTERAQHTLQCGAHVGPKTYKIPKFVVGSSVPNPILLTEGRILRDPGKKLVNNHGALQQVPNLLPTPLAITLPSKKLNQYQLYSKQQT